MKTIIVTLIDAAAGTWIAKLPGKVDLATGGYTEGRTVTVADGVTIPADHDYWQVAGALAPGISTHFGTERDAMVQCFDPNATDLVGAPTTDPICQFRILDGHIEAQV